MLLQKVIPKNLSSRLLYSTAYVFLLSGVISTVFCNAEESKSDKGNGLGEKYNWVSLDEGKEIAQKEKKPLMLIIHKSWCGACKSLKPKFAKSESILELSKNFVMVNTMDEGEPEGDVYKPDGGYIPRILYFDSEHNLMNVVNKGGNDKYKYFYPDPESIANSMKTVLSKASSEDGEKDGDHGAEL